MLPFLKNFFSNKEIFPLIILLIIILAIFRSWFLTGALTGGDWGIVYPEQFSSFYLQPMGWETIYNLGYSNVSFLWVTFPFSLALHFWGFFSDSKILALGGYFVPYILLSFVSSLIAIRSLTNIKNNFFVGLGVLLYTANTYILMVLGGGQVLIGLAYAISPLVILKFVNVIDSPNRNNALIVGLLLSFQVLFDLRIAYVTIVVAMFYFLFSLFNSPTKKNIFSLTFFSFVIPFIITFLIHAFWIIPLLLIGKNPANDLGSGFNSVDAVTYFSFARLENALGLLHPLWPENIFGKVSFMNSSYLILPLLALGSLLFLRTKTLQKLKNNKIERIILFFALVGIIGAFFAKGTNEPFGGLYIWMFGHIPGFVMFRDSTKFYLLIALSYSILIPFSVYMIYTWLQSKKNLTSWKIINLQNIFLFVVFCLLLFLIQPALTGQLSGTFKEKNYPKEYLDLKSYLHNDSEFSRTLWVPRIQRFAYYSSTHPAVNGLEFFTVTSLQDFIKKVQKPESEKLLQESGIKYIVVPFDSEGELFLDDRKYSDTQYLLLKNQLGKIYWLKNKREFGKMIVFEVPDPKDHFWIFENDQDIQWKTFNDTHYQITLPEREEKSTIVFSERFDPQWIAQSNGQKIASQRFHEHYNSFVIPKTTTTFDIYFQPQKWVNIGLVISIVTLLGCIIFLIRYR